jgi:hypothetical protein
MKKITLTVFFLIFITIPTFGQEIDILTFADTHKRVVLVENSRGRKHKPKYGDPYLEEAAKKFKKYPRPWTVPKVIEWYSATKVMNERLLWLRVLSASTDPRAALVLGEAMKEPGQITWTAGYCLQDYFIKIYLGYTDTESTLISAQKWWKENKVRLEEEAKKIPKSK